MRVEEQLHVHNTGLFLKVHISSGPFGSTVDDKEANEPNDPVRLVDDKKWPCIPYIHTKVRYS